MAGKCLQITTSGLLEIMVLLGKARFDSMNKKLIKTTFDSFNRHLRKSNYLDISGIENDGICCVFTSVAMKSYIAQTKDRLNGNWYNICFVEIQLTLAKLKSAINTV